LWRPQGIGIGEKPIVYLREGKGEACLELGGSVARIRWDKVRPIRQIEEKYEPGTVLKCGCKVAERPRDSLASRAAKAEREWLKRIGRDNVR